MAELELIRRLAHQTKVAVLVAEVQAGQFATSELAGLLKLLAGDGAERSSLALGALQALVEAGMPAGRIEDLRKAFSLPPESVSSLGPRPHTAVVPPTGAPPAGASAQQTRQVTPMFRVPFETGPGEQQPPAPQPPVPGAPSASPAAAPTPPAVTARSPAPLRRQAAELLARGAAGTTAGPAPGPARTEPPKSPPEPPRQPSSIRQETFFGSDAKGIGQAVSQAAAAVGRKTVLVADDDKRVRMVFRIKLEQQGFNVLEAPDGADAWRRLEAGGVDALVLDMKMPGMHGLEVLSRLADAGKDLPVVICTAYDRLDDEFVVATYPRLRYLTKPVDADKLAQTLLNLLAEG